jgi:hypothetical protein
LLKNSGSPNFKRRFQKTAALGIKFSEISTAAFCTNRVLNLDAIPTHQKEARQYFEKHYSSHPVSITKPGRFVQVKDDGIFTYMYEISDEIALVKNDRGTAFLEFFLVS